MKPMCSVMRLAAAAFLLAGGVAAVADDVEEKKVEPVSAETVLEKELLGKATVELLVEEVNTLNIDSVFKPGVSHAQIIKAKVPKAKAGREFWVIVSREVATRMLRSGIVDPAEHFRGKEMRVSGTIERSSPMSDPAKTIYKLRVTALEQLELIRTP
jgi:hypothetical protein